MRSTKQPQATSKINNRDAAIQIKGVNLFESITDKIMSVIEAGEASGCISWAGQGASASGMPVNLKTGKAYSGVNVLLLWAETQDKGYASNFWLTFNQARELGGNVRKGEKATQGVFWGTREIEEENEGDTETRKAAFCKAFYVFNLDQIDGITAPDAAPADNVWDAHAVAESLIRSSGARIIEGGNKAFYRPSADVIHMPDRARFECAENFYAVNLHELTHWTGHHSRCNRNLQNRFGDEAYAMEELVAELGSAFLSAETGLRGRIEGHASYIKSWLKVLKHDKRAIITAASKASQAARFILEGEPVAMRATTA